MRNAVVLLASCLGLFGQQFEVASVKPAPASEKYYVNGGPGTDDPGQLTWRSASLPELVLRAYGIAAYQIVSPDWMSAESYDVTAKIPPDTTEEQFRTMLRNLLAERFDLALHHETRTLTGYELTVAKRGAKLQPANPAEGARIAAESRVRAVGFARIPGIARSMDYLTMRLSLALRAPVANKTELPGQYDFMLEFAPDGAPAEATAPPLAVALQEQLGLRFEAKKMPTDVIVIDRANKIPTAN